MFLHSLFLRHFPVLLQHHISMHSRYFFWTFLNVHVSIKTSAPDVAFHQLLLFKSNSSPKHLHLQIQISCQKWFRLVKISIVLFCFVFFQRVWISESCVTSYGIHVIEGSEGYSSRRGHDLLSAVCVRSCLVCGVWCCILLLTWHHRNVKCNTRSIHCPLSILMERIGQLKTMAFIYFGIFANCQN